MSILRLSKRLLASKLGISWVGIMMSFRPRLLFQVLAVLLVLFLKGGVADLGCSYRIRIFPSRIPGQKDSRIRIKEFKYFNQKIVSKLSEI
jgi:hypothetical protein